MVHFLLRAVLSLSLVCLAGTVWADEAKPVKPANCVTFPDLVTHIDNARGDHSKWGLLTSRQLEELRKVFGEAMDPDVTDGVVGHIPDPESPAFLFFFKKDGCLDGSSMLPELQFKAIPGADRAS